MDVDIFLRAVVQCVGEGWMMCGTNWQRREITLLLRLQLTMGVLNCTPALFPIFSLVLSNSLARARHPSNLP